TCVTLPWKPVGDAETRYLINEIVTGEESDVDQYGVRSSHYELYLKAMQELGSSTSAVEAFVSKINIDNYKSIIEQSALPDSVKAFMSYSFATALEAPVHVLASVFTFGREDLIPDMFIQIVQELSKDNPEKLHIFRYYLERHIEVDGDEHSLLGIQMVEKLCGSDGRKWKEATDAALKGLEMRNQLWNGVLEELYAQ
ncbi:MAG: heme oxygenase, partial [Pseudopedobacter saltans]